MQEVMSINITVARASFYWKGCNRHFLLVFKMRKIGGGGKKGVLNFVWKDYRPKIGLPSWVPSYPTYWKHEILKKIRVISWSCLFCFLKNMCHFWWTQLILRITLSSSKTDWWHVTSDDAGVCLVNTVSVLLSNAFWFPSSSIILWLIWYK